MKTTHTIKTKNIILKEQHKNDCPFLRCLGVLFFSAMRRSDGPSVGRPSVPPGTATREKQRLDMGNDQPSEPNMEEQDPYFSFAAAWRQFGMFSMLRRSSFPLTFAAPRPLWQEFASGKQKYQRTEMAKALKKVVNHTGGGGSGHSRCPGLSSGEGGLTGLLKDRRGIGRKRTNPKRQNVKLKPLMASVFH